MLATIVQILDAEYALNKKCLGQELFKGTWLINGIALLVSFEGQVTSIY